MEKIDKVRLFEGITYIDPAFVDEANEPLKKRCSNIIWLKKAGALAASFVFAAAILLSINAAFPAFAENLPLIGEIFRQLNSIGSNAPSYDGVVQAVGESAENNQFKVTVTEAYCDGEYVFFALRLQPKDTKLLKMETLYTEEDTGNGVPGWSVSINGESHGCTLPVFARRGAYFESEPIRIAFSTEQDDPIQVEAIIGNLFGRTQETVDANLDGQAISLEPVCLNFDLPVNTGYNRQEAVQNAETGGLKLQSWSSSPSKLSVTLSYPYFDTAGVSASARTDEGLDLGEDLREFGDFGDGRYSLGDTAVQTCSFIGPPEGTKNVVVTVYKASSYERTAGTSGFGEFTIDLETGDVTITENYLDAGFAHVSIEEYADKTIAEEKNSAKTIAPSRSPVPKMP